jgi:hypothetical protein
LARPLIDISATHEVTHKSHVIALFRLGHAKNLFYGSRSRSGGHKDSRSALPPTRATPRQNRTRSASLLVIAGSDKLLGNEIHAVVKAGDDAQVCCTKELEHFLGLKMARKEANRRVFFVAIPRVDLADKTLRFVL